MMSSFSVVFFVREISDLAFSASSLTTMSGESVVCTLMTADVYSLRQVRTHPFYSSPNLTLTSLSGLILNNVTGIAKRLKQC